MAPLGPIVATPLTIPKLVSKTGLLLSTLLLASIAGVNLITGSHVLEAMGIANACYRLEARRRKSVTISKEMKDVSIAVDVTSTRSSLARRS